MRERPHETCRFDNPDNWYAKLWDVMMDGVQAPGQVTTNAVKFVTFNYDRSLEFFFHEAIKLSFNLDDKQAFGVWSKLGILHVYGSLGTLNAQSPFRPYDWNVTKESLVLAAKEIKVIPDSRDDDKDFQRASNWLSRATEIVFLGFGFDSLSVRRLNLDGALEWCKKQSNRTPRI